MTGRPTTYSDEIVNEARSYINNYKDHNHAVPSVVGLCSVIDRARSTVYAWADDESKEFSDILDQINEKQEIVTFTEALRGNYNPTIAKLLLAKHGYKDESKSVVVAQVSQVSSLSDEEVKALSSELDNEC